MEALSGSNPLQEIGTDGAKHLDQVSQRKKLGM